MAWDDGDTGSLYITSFLKVACNQSTGNAMKFCFSQDMVLSHRISKNSTLPKPRSILVGDLAHQSIMPRIASSQPHHMSPPSKQHQQVWFRNVANNSTSRIKIHNLLHFLQSEANLFRPDPN
ncbi:hypothetical protein AVEN_26275-1 [Araneus ventricosus]|uniref:Uncharacterized protein n=1 Tax=Araneus ventricosus TaxID=182803 RepID=A0A4Y2ALX4_ARAVE|nr:hypothetical protein AVEN_26275-1 [Araneus ventricosus]